LRTRFWIEVGLAAVCGFLFLLTLVWKDWIEAFGFDPDNHSGSVEWAIVAALAAVTVVFVVIARVEWRRSELGTSQA
jgi:hypothetical protein